MNTTKMTIFAAMFATGLAGSAFAADDMAAPKDAMAHTGGMAKPKAMKHDSMKHDGMKHHAMKGDAMKGDAMKSDAMKSDSMAAPAH
jgi:pentapeptide MXKDX repeat protein